MTHIKSRPGTESSGTPAHPRILPSLREKLRTALEDPRLVQRSRSAFYGTSSCFCTPAPCPPALLWFMWFSVLFPFLWRNKPKGERIPWNIKTSSDPLFLDSCFQFQLRAVPETHTPKYSGKSIRGQPQTTLYIVGVHSCRKVIKPMSLLPDSSKAMGFCSEQE